MEHTKKYKTRDPLRKELSNFITLFDQQNQIKAERVRERVTSGWASELSSFDVVKIKIFRITIT